MFFKKGFTLILVSILVVQASILIFKLPLAEAAGTSYSTESDYVNGFTDTVKQWTTHTGASPWLDNNILNSIGTFTTLQMDANYTFANTAIPYFANITLIQLTVSTLTTSDLVGAVCYLSTGGVWSSGYVFGFDGSLSWITESATVTSLFSTLTNINNCVMKINSSRAGASSSVTVRYVYLKITYAIAGTTTSTFFSSIPFTLSFAKLNSFTWTIQSIIPLAVNVNGLASYFLNAFGNIPFAFLTEIQRSISFSQQGTVPLSFTVASTYARLVNILNFFGNIPFIFSINLQNALSFTRQGVASLGFLTGTQRAIIINRESSIPSAFSLLNNYGQTRSLAILGNIVFQFVEAFQKGITFTYASVIPFSFTVSSLYSQITQVFLYFFGYIPLSFASSLERIVSFNVQGVVPLTFIMNGAYTRLATLLNLFGTVVFNLAINMAKAFSFNIFSAETLMFTVNSIVNLIGAPLTLFIAGLVNFIFNIGNVGYATIPLSNLTYPTSSLAWGAAFIIIGLLIGLLLTSKRGDENG